VTVNAERDRGDPWPKRREIVNTSMRAAIKVKAWVWRRLWNVALSPV